MPGKITEINEKERKGKGGHAETPDALSSLKKKTQALGNTDFHPSLLVGRGGMGKSRPGGRKGFYPDLRIRSRVL